MARRKRANELENNFLAINIIGFDASIDASVNFEVRDSRHYQDDAKIFRFDSQIEINGICTHPENRANEHYAITVYGTEQDAHGLSLTLSDCHEHDEEGIPIWRKIRGKQVPSYKIPKGIGFMERQRETKIWAGWLWVPPHTISNMLAILPHIRPLFLYIHEQREGRRHRMIGVTLKTSDPVSE